LKDKIIPIFWNLEEKRIRAGWRVAIAWVGTLIIFFPIQAWLSEFVPKSLPKDQRIDILIAVFAVVITGTLWIFRTKMDKRPFKSLGLKMDKHTLKDVIAGYGISAILVAMVLAVEVGLGWLSFEVIEFDTYTLVINLLYMFLVTGLIVSWWENLFFISYLYLNFKDGCGIWCAYILCLLIFSLLHLANPHASLWSFFGIVLIHAYEIYAFLKRKNLWLAFGIHAGWNSFQGLAGFSVSGQSSNQIIKQINVTPDWLGGGEFGPEAGLIILLVGIVAFALIKHYSNWVRGKDPLKVVSANH